MSSVRWRRVEMEVAAPERIGGGPPGDDVDLGRVGRLVLAGVVVMVVVLGAAVQWGSEAGWPLVGPGLLPAVPLDGAERESVPAIGARATAAVSGVGCGGDRVSGSGVVIDDGIVTNRHVVGGADRATVALQQVGVTASSAGPDLALLERPAGAVAGLELAPGDPGPGEPVVLVASYGGGARWIESRVVGVVDGSAYGAGGPVLLVDVPTVPGYSGGPVLDRRGRLVGVLYAVDLSTAQSLAVPVSELAAWLREPPNGQASVC